MSFRERQGFFLTPFYMLFEFFLLKYLFMLVYPLDNLVLFVLTLIIGILNTLPELFEARKSRPITRVLTEISAIWMWASLMYLFDIIIIYVLGITDFNIKIILLSLVPLIGVYAYFKAHKLVVKEKIIKSDNIYEDINVIHISDVHFGSVRYKKIIKQLSEQLKELSSSCDVAIISGDLADGSLVVSQDDFMPLKDIGIPIIFTPGNHDYYLGLENVVKACKKAGIVVLDNQSLEINNLNIYGLSYSFDDIGMPTSNELKNQIKADKTNIIIYHVPYKWENHSKIGFDIQLSGHTHGGQFYPVTWLCDIIFKYNKGLFKDESGHYLNVTTGVGSMNQPLRWGTDSEIVILKLRKN